MRISSAKKPARAKSTTPKESSSSRFGGFFRSISSRRFAPKTDSNANNNERTTTNTRRSRSRETTTERSKSSDERPCSSSSQRQLRSKSPSRERIEAFMADMKERERAVSRERRPQRINSNDRLVALFQASDERLLARQNSNQSLQRSSNHSQKSLLKDKNTTIINTRKTNSNENLMVRAPSDKGLIKRTDSNERLHNAPNDKERVRPRNPSKERLKRFLDSRAHSQRFLASVSSSGEEPDGKSVFPRSQSVCITPASAKSSTSIGYFKSFTSQSNRSIGSLSPRALFNQEPEILEDHSNEWHATISKRDWETLEQMMQSYNHKLYNKSPQKKLRVLKYFPNKAAPSIKEAYSGACPLLQVDSKGRTPLHLACKEHMPQKLFMRLFFMERNAACKLDTDGRVPLHYAIIANHSKHILDRLVSSHFLCLRLLVVRRKCNSNSHLYPFSKKISIRFGQILLH